MISKYQFEVLVCIESHQKQKLTQRDISNFSKLSVGLVNKTIAELNEMGLIKITGSSEYEITDAGYRTLEPFKIKKAVFFAAGFGSRLIPVTLNTPKPLIRVNGTRLIDTLIDAVLDQGITDITIVRGYLKEQFDVLKMKYPMIKFIDNDIYNEANNISSAYLAKDLLDNTLVLESDLLLFNKNIIRKYEYESLYLAIPKEISDDWCFETKQDVITRVSIGGKDVDQMVGISYWNHEDGLKMAKDIEKVFKMPGGKEKYWDEVALTECKNDYSISVRRCTDSDIVEIDTYAELCEIDAVYKI